MKHRLHSWEYVLTFTLENGKDIIEQQHVYPVTENDNLLLARSGASGLVEVSLSCNVPLPDEHGFFIINKEQILHQNQRWEQLETSEQTKVPWESVRQIKIEQHRGQIKTLNGPFTQKELVLEAS